VKVLNANAEHARRLIMNVSGKLGPYHTASPEIERVLDTAIITAPDKRDPKLIKKLDAIAGRILRKTKPARARKKAKR
jgi:5'-methylthioadenosine phosphorylase